MSQHISLASLDDLPGAVGRPAYARGDLSPGILHFGVGNFHRAHQANYLDRLFSTGQGQDWAIVGAGVMEGDRKARDILAAQDWLTTLVEQEAQQSAAHVIGSMVDYIEPGNVPAIVAALADPAIRIVSLTITEGGYFLDAASRFDPAHQAIVADGRSPEAPRTVFGILVAGLKARRAADQAPFTIMSCDNIPHNGHVTRNAVCGLAALSDPAFADWIGDTVAFPNGMVDRITPATSDREREMLQKDFGVLDAWPVYCESFTQWVLEDDFPLGRPPLEEVGVQFVADVSPYELMKIRILNGGHALIAYPAGLLDIHFVHEAMEHPLIRAFLLKVEQDEILPGVPPVPDTDLGAYLALIERRIANPKIGDTVRRLCFDGSNRQPKFIVPSVQDALARGGPVIGLALASALWCRYCFGETESGADIAPNDPSWAALVPLARAAKQEPTAWLAGLPGVYGTLATNGCFTAAFAAALDTLWRDGTHAALSQYVESDTL